MTLRDGVPAFRQAHGTRLHRREWRDLAPRPVRRLPPRRRSAAGDRLRRRDGAHPRRLGRVRAQRADDARARAGRRRRSRRRPGPRRGSGSSTSARARATSRWPARRAAPPSTPATSRRAWSWPAWSARATRSAGARATRRSCPTTTGSSTRSSRPSARRWRRARGARRGELARVLRPGGRLVLAAWTPTTLPGELDGRARRSTRCPRACGCPSDWGRPEIAQQRLGPHFDGLRAAACTP